MCSNTDSEYDGLTLMGKIGDNYLTNTWCRKCVAKTEANIVLRKKDAYCKSCFLSSVTHKFRACLGKSKTMKPGDRVLIGFSGSENSVALLHLIQIGLQDTSHKKLMFEPFIVFIDESNLFNLTTEDRNELSQAINQIVQTYNYPFYKVPIELSIQSEEEMDNYLVKGLGSVDGKVLTDLFSGLKDVTARTDLLAKLRNNILVKAAKSLRCNKVFTAETADDLAVKLLTNVSLGRGAQLPYDVGFSDDRSQEVKVIRPLRDLSKKELAFYNVFRGLKSVSVPSFLTKIDTHSSIQRLTETFLSDLQAEFPSTVSTVFRVADKLTTSKGDYDICPLCNSPLDTEDMESSSLNATQFSRQVSSAGPSQFDAENLKKINSDSGCCENNSGASNGMCNGSGSCSSKLPEHQLQRVLCYGCNLILKHSEANLFPEPIIKELQESCQRMKMKKEIEEFLL